MDIPFAMICCRVGDGEAPIYEKPRRVTPLDTTTSGEMILLDDWMGTQVAPQIGE